MSPPPASVTLLPLLATFTCQAVPLTRAQLSGPSPFLTQDTQCPDNAARTDPNDPASCQCSVHYYPFPNLVAPQGTATAWEGACNRMLRCHGDWRSAESGPGAICITSTFSIDGIPVVMRIHVCVTVQTSIEGTPHQRLCTLGY